MSATKIHEIEAPLFRALGHPVRLELLEALRGDEECVCHLSALLRKPQPYVSQHLAELREAGLVIDRRDGQRIYYRLTDPGIGTILDAARLMLVKAGKVKSEDIASTLIAKRPVLGCECPRCTAA